ncbi:hypothetical protein L195_g033968 [Trifolium pratense]|uniref:Uncharacterized protein n=1 Tax=Trifolium pratense TaxID=57577 RepID=A0A2K3LHH9_TRIPR|nr:hypothetical protein L195_g033968 [Trifolium pratense]
MCREKHKSLLQKHQHKSIHQPRFVRKSLVLFLKRVNTITTQAKIHGEKFAEEKFNFFIHSGVSFETITIMRVISATPTKILGKARMVSLVGNHEKENGKEELLEFSGNAVHSKTCFATRYGKVVRLLTELKKNMGVVRMIECDASGKGVELFLCIVADMFAYEKELFNCFSNTNMAIRLLIATISQQGETLLCLHPDSGIPSFCNSAFCANFGAIFCTVSATFCSISYKLSCFHFYSLVSSYYGNFISQRLNQQQLKLHQNTALQDYNIYHSGLVCSIVQTTGETIDLTWEWNSLKEKNNRKSVACDFGEKTATGVITRAKRHQIGITKM